MRRLWSQTKHKHINTRRLKRTHSQLPSLNFINLKCNSWIFQLHWEQPFYNCSMSIWCICMEIPFFCPVNIWCRLIDAIVYIPYSNLILCYWALFLNGYIMYTNSHEVKCAWLLVIVFNLLFPIIYLFLTMEIHMIIISVMQPTLLRLLRLWFRPFFAFMLIAPKTMTRIHVQQI